MRFLVTFALLATSLCIPVPTHADDELFSEVALEFVYATADEKKSDEKSNPEFLLPVRVTGSATLIKLLKSAGYEASKIDNQQVSVQIQQAGWKLRAKIKTDVAADRLIVKMLLAKIENEASIDQAKLLRLLSLAGKKEAVCFAYNETEGMIELRRVMPNRGLTSEGLQRELVELATFAQSHQDAWSELVKPGKPASRPPETKPSKSEPNKDVRNLSLVGTWSAPVGNGQAFAIRIAEDESFQLVHIKAGKSVSSKGKASRSGNQLTLSGNDGTKIIGTIGQQTTDAFQLAIPGTTLNFKKAK